MNRSKSVLAFVCLAGVCVLAAVGAFAISPKPAIVHKSNWPQSAIPAPPRGQWMEDRRLTFDPAASQLSINFAWSIAADEAGRVHVVWFDQRDGNSQVYYKRSGDGGATWGPDVRLSYDTAWREYPAIAASGDHVYVVWHDSRGEGLDIYFKCSADGGLTWGGETQLTSDGSSAHASIAAQGERAHVIWGGHQDGPQAEIFTSHSTDAGLTWAVATRLSELPYDSWVPTIAVAGQQVYAAWVDTRDGNEEEYFRRSTDGGATWGPVARLTHHRANSWAPAIAASGDNVHLVWFDQQDSPFQPLDAEEKLNEAMRLLELPVQPAPVGVMVVHPELAAQRRAQEKFQLIQAEALGWIARGGDVIKLQAILREFEEMGQRGATYLEKERKLDEAIRLMGMSYTPGATDDLPLIFYLQALQIRVQDKLKQIQAAAPAWAQRGGSLQQLEALLREFQQMLTVANSEWDIYYRRSTDGGQTWEPMKRLTDAPLQSARPSIALAGAALHVVWYDLRNGNAEVYYKHSPNAGVNWTPDVRLTDAPGESLHPTIAATGDAAHVVWFDYRDGNAEIYYKRTRQRANNRDLPKR